MYKLYRRAFYLLYKFARSVPINSMPDVSGVIGMSGSLYFYFMIFEMLTKKFFGFRIIPKDTPEYALLFIGGPMLFHFWLFVLGGRLEKIIEEFSDKEKNKAVWTDRVLIILIFLPWLGLPFAMVLFR